MVRLSLYRDDYRLGQLKRELTLGRQERHVLVDRGLIGAFDVLRGGSIVDLGFRSRERIGFQIVGFSLDHNRSERHLDFVLFDLDDAAGYLRALGNHGLAIDLDRRGEAGGKGVADLVLVSGERLAYRCADRGTFRHRDHRGWLRGFLCYGFRRDRLCFRGDSLACVGVLRLGRSLVRGSIMAKEQEAPSQNGCRGQTEPEVPMCLKLEHFTPPKGYPGGEWDEVAGLIPSPDESANSKRGVSLFSFYKSYRTWSKESLGICDLRSLRDTGPSASNARAGALPTAGLGVASRASGG